MVDVGWMAELTTQDHMILTRAMPRTAAPGRQRMAGGVQETGLRLLVYGMQFGDEFREL